MRATATSLGATLRDQAFCDAREALPNRRQVIRPLDVQMTRTLTIAPQARKDPEPEPGDEEDGDSKKAS